MFGESVIRYYTTINLAFYLKLAKFFYYIVVAIFTKLSRAFVNCTTLSATTLCTLCTSFVHYCIGVIFNCISVVCPFVDFKFCKWIALQFIWNFTATWWLATNLAPCQIIIVTPKHTHLNVIIEPYTFFRWCNVATLQAAIGAGLITNLTGW